MRRTRKVPVDEVAISAEGRLVVCPRLTDAEDFAYIWREANGVRWDAASRTLTTLSDPQPDQLAWLSRIIDAARNEYGCILVATPETRWSNVSPELQLSM